MVTRGQYFAIKAALTATEKELINYYELQWHLRHRVPTTEEVTTYLKQKYEKEGKNTKITQTSINYYLTRKPVIKALDDRGIPWRQHSQDELTATQVAAAITVMNMVDDRPIADKLDQLGITTVQYQAWLNDPQFKNLVNNLADQNLTNIRPAAITEFTKKINQGDWNAIKYWLETTGELKGNDAPQSEVLLPRLIEILQKHIKDPEILMAIAQDMKLAAANRTLEVVAQPAQIEATAMDDQELEYAKKQLGIG